MFLLCREKERLTRKALHPRNDCRHWIFPAGSFLTVVTPTWFSQRRERDSRRDKNVIPAATATTYNLNSPWDMRFDILLINIQLLW